ncbi:MAG: hypothetical protein RIC55_03785 [Pirellulaceae bacterium]
MNHPDDLPPGVPMGPPQTARGDGASTPPSVRSSDLLPPGAEPQAAEKQIDSAAPAIPAQPAARQPPASPSGDASTTAPAPQSGLAPGPHVVVPKHVAPKPVAPPRPEATPAQAAPRPIQPVTPFDDEIATSLPPRPPQTAVGYYSPPPAQSDSSLAAIIVLASIVLCLVMVCGGIGGAVYWAYSVRSGEPAADPLVTPSPTPGSPIETASDPFYSSTSDWAPGDVSSALRALRSQLDVRIEQGADYLATASADESRRGEVSAALVAQLNHRSSAVRQKAMQALVRWRHDSAAPAVLAALRRGQLDEVNRKRAIEWLGVWRHREAGEEMAALLGDPVFGDSAEQALSRLGSSAQPLVIDFLADANPQRAASAERLLTGYAADLDELRLTAHLRAVVRADSALRQRSAAWLADQAVDPLRQNEVARALDRALAEDAGSSRDTILRAIEVWGDEQSVPALVSVLESDNLRGGEVLRILSDMNTPASTSAIASLLANLVHAEQAEKILLARGEAAKGPVLAYVHDEATATRTRARNVASQLGVTEAEIVAQSLEDLKSIKENRQIAAAKWLGGVDGDDHPAHRADIGERLVRLMSSTHSFTRAAAAQSIPNWVTTADAAQLLPLLGSSDDTVAISALNGLLAIDDSSLPTLIATYLPTLFAKANCREPAIAALQKAGEKSEDAVLGMISPDFDVIIVASAVRVLGEVGTEKSVAALGQLASYAGSNGYSDLKNLAQAAVRAINLRRKAKPAK